MSCALLLHTMGKILEKVIYKRLLPIVNIWQTSISEYSVRLAQKLSLEVDFLVRSGYGPWRVHFLSQDATRFGTGPFAEGYNVNVPKDSKFVG